MHVENGTIFMDSRTSGATTPTVTSIITLVNDARILAEKKPVKNTLHGVSSRCVLLEQDEDAFPNAQRFID